MLKPARVRFSRLAGTGRSTVMTRCRKPARHTVQQCLDALGLTRQVGLEPAVRRYGKHLLHRHQRRAAEDEGHARRLGGSRHGKVSLEARERRQAHRRDAKGCAKRWPTA